MEPILLPPIEHITPEAIALYRRSIRQSVAQWQATSAGDSLSLVTMAIAIETELPLLSNELRHQAAGKAPLAPPIGTDESAG